MKQLAHAALLLASLLMSACASHDAQRVPAPAPQPLPLEARIYPRAFITTLQGPHAYFRQHPPTP